MLNQPSDASSFDLMLEILLPNCWHLRNSCHKQKSLNICSPIRFPCVPNGGLSDQLFPLICCDKTASTKLQPIKIGSFDEICADINNPFSDPRGQEIGICPN